MELDCRHSEAYKFSYYEFLIANSNHGQILDWLCESRESKLRDNEMTPHIVDYWALCLALSIVPQLDHSGECRTEENAFKSIEEFAAYAEEIRKQGNQQARTKTISSEVIS